MWLFLNNAFLSIVDEVAAKGGYRARLKGTALLVRSRKAGHIESVFGADVKVTRTPDRDYLYRAVIQRGVVEDAIMKAIAAIDYGNFKNSVREKALHDAYSDCWFVMNDYQRGKYPKSRGVDYFDSADDVELPGMAKRQAGDESDGNPARRAPRRRPRG